MEQEYNIDDLLEEIKELREENEQLKERIEEYEDFLTNLRNELKWL